MEHKGLDPKTLKVSQLRRILVENDITFPANARKPALVKLFEERVRQRLELSSETSKGNDSIQKAVKSEAKNADRKRILKSKKHESNSGASKSVNVETNKRKREENSTDNTIPVQVKEEKSSKRKRKKRSNRTTKSLESPSKPKLESEESSVTLSPEMEIREEHKEEFSNGELIATEESKKPELPNLKVSNEFLVQLNKELASATTESYDHSIKSANSSSVRIEREEPVETATGAEVRKGNDPIINLDKKAREAVDKTTSEEAKEELVREPKALDMREGITSKENCRRQIKQVQKAVPGTFLRVKLKEAWIFSGRFLPTSSFGYGMLFFTFQFCYPSFLVFGIESRELESDIVVMKSPLNPLHSQPSLKLREWMNFYRLMHQIAWNVLNTPRVLLL